MLNLIASISIILSFGIIASQIYGFSRLKKYILNDNQTTYSNLPKEFLSVILPCRGLDPGFEDNLPVLLNQNYCDENKNKCYEVIFVLGHQDQNAKDLIERACKKYPQTKTKIVMAQPDFKNVHKLNSQLAGLKNINTNSKFIAFIDSDVVSDYDFLANLVLPLNDPNVGIATGYRFYIPTSFNIPGLLRTVWNRVSAWEMANPKLVFAWGGAMAVTKSNLDKIDIFKLWYNCADDDLSLTKAVKQLGLKVKFVSSCIVGNYANGTWPEVIEWINRQLLLTKFYYPELWLKAILNALSLAVFALTQLLFLVVNSSVNNVLFKMVTISGICVLLSELFLFFDGHRFWHKNLIKSWLSNNYLKQKIDLSFYSSFIKSLLQFYLILPIAHIVLPIFSLYSIFLNTLNWRGLSYRIKSAHNIILISN